MSSLWDILLIGTMTMIGSLFLLLRFLGPKRLLMLGRQVEITTTVLLLLALLPTYNGAMIALVSGIELTGILGFIRWLAKGRDRLARETLVKHRG